MPPASLLRLGVGPPNDFVTVFGTRAAQCPLYGCLLELTIQMAVIMVGKQALNNFVELLLPGLALYWGRIMRWCRQKSGSHQPHLPRPWERDYLTLTSPGDLSLFPEYEEMCIQFGFITCFVSAFPLGPVFALLNNLVEIRVDARKFCLQLQRPPPQRATDIGAWQQVIETITFIGVLTNGAVIAFTGDFMDKLVYRANNGGSMEGYIDTLYPRSPPDPAGMNPENLDNCHYAGFYDDQGVHTSLFYQSVMAKLAFFLVFEHTVFLIKILCNIWIPDVPQGLRKARRRRAYFARKLIDGIDEDVDMKGFTNKQVNQIAEDEGLAATFPPDPAQKVVAADHLQQRLNARRQESVV